MKRWLSMLFKRGTKVFTFDAENEYQTLVKKNGGEYIDLYSKRWNYNHYK